MDRTTKIRSDINITGVIGKSMVLNKDEQAEFRLIYSIEPESVIVQVKVYESPSKGAYKY